MVLHNIPPVFDENSKILILGSFPSVRSRETEFYYGHPQNRFWRVISVVFGAKVPETTDEKRALLLSNRIALWDVIASCEITGSADSSIKSVTANDLTAIFDSSSIERIYVNGKTAESYYKKLIEPKIGRKAVCLPSTSPANAAYSLERLTEAWREIAE